jgi:hypothetical protein
VVLRNSPDAELTVAQIAAHLQTPPWNITNDLQMHAAGKSGRLRGTKVYGQGAIGRGGQWRVALSDYLTRLQIPAEDVTAAQRGEPGAAGPDGLPTLTRFADAARTLQIPEALLQVMVRQNRWPHITFGRSKYLTHNQLRRISVLADEERWAARAAVRRLSPDLPESAPAGPDVGSVR